MVVRRRPAPDPVGRGDHGDGRTAGLLSHPRSRHRTRSGRHVVSHSAGVLCGCGRRPWSVRCADQHRTNPEPRECRLHQYARLAPRHLLFGADINGTQAWYRLGGFTFQPSEPGKLVLIVTLATVFSGDRVGFQRMAAGLLLAGVPIGLILLQPDLGTVLVYIVVTAVMIMMSNISMRLILLLVLAAITAITMIFTSDVLEDYQKDRLTVFVLMTTPSPSWAPTPCGSPTTPSNPRSPSATGG